MKKALSLILAMITAAAVVTGCTTTLAKTADGEYDKGAIIDMYLADGVYNLDPQENIVDESMLKVMSLVYEGLTTIDETGKWKNAGMKDYYVSVDDGERFVIVVNLTDNRWSDGRTVQAADYVYSWKRLLEAEKKADAAALLYEVKNAQKIKIGDATIDDLGVAAVDTYSLEIEFESKIDLNMFFENCAALALVPLREDTITRYGEDIWAMKTASILTNGPFIPKEFANDSILRLERSNYYYLSQEDDSREHLDKYVIPYRLLTKYGEDQAAAYDSGSLFYIGEFPLATRANYKDSAVVTDMMATHTYVFNTKNELFAKPEVRRALSMALDRQAIADIVVFAKPATGYVPYKVFDTAAGTSFRTVGGDVISASADVAGAKSLLQSAGVKSGSFTLTVRDSAVDVAIAEYVADAWKSLGFTVTIEKVKNTNGADATYFDVVSAKYKSGEFDVIAVDETLQSPDAFVALSKFAVAYSGNGVDMNSANYDLYSNVSGYNSEAYNTLIDSAFAEKDRTARAAILHDAEKALLNDMPVMPVVFLQDAYLAVGDLSNVGTTYFGTRDFKRTELKDYMTYKAATDTSAETEAAE